MPRAFWNDTLLAEAPEVMTLEGSDFFPPDAVRQEYLRESGTRTRSSWLGTAQYFDVVVGDQILEDAAWCYPVPNKRARRVAGWIAFWKDVRIEP